MDRFLYSKDDASLDFLEIPAKLGLDRVTFTH
jgi:hypothetical protein